MNYGAIEAGGTKILVGTGDKDGKIHAYETLPTTSPEAAMSAISDFFANRSIEAIGVGSFGPLVANPAHADYGQLTTTPKLRWRHFNWVHELQHKLHVPVFVDTDVNTAALGEARWGAASGLRNCLYVTVGTGIGGGIIVENNVVHGLIHPEIGHLMVRRHPDDAFPGLCPFHRDCLEGLASGPALAARWGVPGQQLGALNDEVWDIEAYYLAQAITALSLTLSTERVIMGGGVMNQPTLMPKVRTEVLRLLGGYLEHPQIIERIEEYIVSPGLGQFAGLKGAIALAIDRMAAD